MYTKLHRTATGLRETSLSAACPQMLSFEDTASGGGEVMKYFRSGKLAMIYGPFLSWVIYTHRVSKKGPVTNRNCP